MQDTARNTPPSTGGTARFAPGGLPVLAGELGTLYGLMDLYGPQARIIDVVRDLQRLNREMAA